MITEACSSDLGLTVWDVHSLEDCDIMLTHLNAPNLQNAKTSPFMEVTTPPGDP